MVITRGEVSVEELRVLVGSQTPCVSRDRVRREVVCARVRAAPHTYIHTHIHESFTLL